LTVQRPLQVPPDLPELSIAFKQQAIIRAHPITIDQANYTGPYPRGRIPSAAE
jgi:hypothetical protein